MDSLTGIIQKAQDKLINEAFYGGQIKSINPWENKANSALNAEDLKKINSSKSRAEIWISRFIKNATMIECESNKITPNLHFTEYIIFMNLKNVKKLKKKTPDFDARIFENNKEIFID